MRKNKKLFLTISIVTLTFLLACILNACKSENPRNSESSSSISDGVSSIYSSNDTVNFLLPSNA